MKIRIEALPDELDTAIEKLHDIFVIHSVSKPYKNRNSNYQRVYLHVEMEKE